ncbi:MAG TPA: alkaline phosphatase family protein [Candidatus Sulfotelmatobacter sp.]|jgi:hypothetical protein|nr:alkaline phosphatase family protein [Candidatus Sulfotelmatobacter sp.]
MKHSFSWKTVNYTLLGIYILALISFINALGQKSPIPNAYAASRIQHVFLIMMENHNWSDIKGNSSAPYINNILLSMGAHAEQYYNPSGIHPSLPNSLWLEAGTNFGILNDNDPASEHQSTTQHLTSLLKNAGLTWNAYEEDINGTTCPLANTEKYAVRHEPFTYFDDVTNNLNPKSQNCIQHIKPYQQFITDLAKNAIANYNFITPNLIHDMHDGTIQQGDAWLSKEIPIIMNSQAYKNGVIIVTWDEGEYGSDGPIGMIIVSPFAKRNYSNTIHYDHSSTLKTIEEIFGTTPLLGGATKATDLRDFFTITINNSSPTNTICLGCSSASGSGSQSSSSIVSATPDKNQTSCTTNRNSSSHNYKEKNHRHHNGAISKFTMQILQLLISFINQVIGAKMNIPLPENFITNPCP